MAIQNEIDKILNILATSAKRENIHWVGVASDHYWKKKDDIDRQMNFVVELQGNICHIEPVNREVNSFVLFLEMITEDKEFKLMPHEDLSSQLAIHVERIINEIQNSPEYLTSYRIYKFMKDTEELSKEKAEKLSKDDGLDKEEMDKLAKWLRELRYNWSSNAEKKLRRIYYALFYQKQVIEKSFLLGRRFSYEKLLAEVLENIEKLNNTLFQHEEYLTFIRRRMVKIGVKDFDNLSSSLFMWKKTERKEQAKEIRMHLSEAYNDVSTAKQLAWQYYFFLSHREKLQNDNGKGSKLDNILNFQISTIDEAQKRNTELQHEIETLSSGKKLEN